jgi:TatD DNase family protein
MIVDVHAHLTDEQFDADRSEIAEGLKQNGVKWIITNGYDRKSCFLAVILAGWYKNIYVAVGMHPESAGDYDAVFEDNLKEYCANEKVLAIGEIGLDYHYDTNPPRKTQRETFVKQLILAEKLDKPVIVHSRDAAQDTFDILRDNMPSRGAVLHSFSQSEEMTKRYLELNVMFSFSGVVTFKNASNVKLSAGLIPPERILTETDCPYMAPEPFRGKRCCPAYAANTAAVLSEIKGIDYAEFCELTVANAERFFKVIPKEEKKKKGGRFWGV